MKARFAFVCFTAIFTTSISVAQAIDLNGFWISSDFTCFGAEPPTELFKITDDGINYQSVKLRGDPCVPTGSVSFFGNRGKTPACKFVLGNQSSPASSIANCSLTIIDNNTISALGVTLSRVNNVGELASIKVTKVDCKNSTTGDQTAGTIVNLNSGWTCDTLPTKKGDTIIETITGKAQ